MKSASVTLHSYLKCHPATETQKAGKLLGAILQFCLC